MPEASGGGKQAVGLRVAPPVIDMVRDLVEWLDAPSQAWVWETAIIRWHAVEQARRSQEQELPPRREGDQSAVDRARAALEQAQTKEEIKRIVASLPDKVLRVLAGSVDMTSLSDEELEALIAGVTRSGTEDLSQ